MTKKFLLYALVLGVQVSYAQTFNEWFRQRKTQIKYLVDQISALTTYTKFLQKGYDIARNGTNLITNIKHGDFNLHDGYFTSLNLVSSVVSSDSRISAVIADQQSIVKIFGEMIAFAKESGQMTATEIAYLNGIYDNLEKECEKDLDELFLVNTSGKLKMKEDERIRRINLVYDRMKDKLSFSKVFTKQVIVLIRQKIMEQQEANRQK